ncbi:DUF1456 family protein [Haemophilus influenzae]|jgi:protein of unknown function (DUF1456)|nr:DUF1456 family protein [Haemophilus influenzae]
MSINLFDFMTNNEVFNHLLFLTGLNNDDENLIALLSSQGITVNKSQIRRWRRKIDHPQGRAIPDDVFQAFFRILFEQKNKDKDFCSYPKK